MEEGVSAGILGVLGEIDGGGGVVTACAGDDLHPVVGPFDAEFHHGDVFPDAHGGAFAGGAADADGVHATLDLLVDEGAESVVVDGAALVKGGDDGGTGTGEDGLSHGVTSL